MKYFTLYESKHWVEFFLIFSIILFILLSLSFLTYLIFIRLKRIKKNHFELQNIALIEKMMFRVVFDNVRYATVEKENRIAFKKTSFRGQLMSSVINLHKNYEGIYQKNIQVFYTESLLLKDSFKKIKDKKWEIKCQGIEELSQMNISKAYDVFVKLSKSKNKILKITALKGCIKLNETKGISQLINHEEVLDDWTQLNIIDAIRIGDVMKINGIELLLTSRNESVVSLGLKIIQTFFLSQKECFIQEVIDTTNNLIIKDEASKVLNYLHSNL